MGIPDGRILKLIVGSIPTGNTFLNVFVKGSEPLSPSWFVVVCNLFQVVVVLECVCVVQICGVGRRVCFCLCLSWNIFSEIHGSCVALRELFGFAFFGCGVFLRNESVCPPRRLDRNVNRRQYSETTKLGRVTKLFVFFADVFSVGCGCA